MTDPTYKVSEVVGTSTESVQQAIRNGIRKASETIRNLDWFEVEEVRGDITEDGEVGRFQVVLRLGFRIED